MEEVLAVVGVIFVGWLGWLSLTTIQNKVKINTLVGNDEVLERDLGEALKNMERTSEDLKNSFREMRQEVKSDISSISGRLDTFMRTEIDALKIITGSK